MSLSYDEFLDFYKERGFLPNDISKSKNKLNEKQLKFKYEKYLKSEQKKIDRRERLSKEDPQWTEVKSKLNLTECYFKKYLEKNGLIEDLHNLYKNAGILLSIIDPAHVFGRGSYPHMKYDLNNIVPLNRYTHSCLDQNRHPITGKSISHEEVRSFWILIVGIETYRNLFERSFNE